MSSAAILQTNRFGEDGPVPPRSTRVFSLQESWYFTTREGANIGPFETRDQADTGVSDFIEFISLASPAMLRIFFNSLLQNEGKKRAATKH